MEEIKRSSASIFHLLACFLRKHKQPTSFGLFRALQYWRESRHSESHVTRKRTAGCGYLNLARGCTDWNRGCDLRSRDHGEFCCCTVEGDAARARQVGPQYSHSSSHSA